MPIYTLEWKKGRRPAESDAETFFAKNDESAFVHAVAATCITMENGKPNLRDFLAVGAKELRRGDVIIFPTPNARTQSDKHPHLVLVYAAAGSRRMQ